MANEIDYELQKYYDTVDVSAAKNGYSELQNKISFLINADNRVMSSLQSVFSGDASKSVMDNFNALENNCKKVQSSIDSELISIINRAETLKNDIANLINMSDSLNSAISRYNELSNQSVSATLENGNHNPNYDTWISEKNDAYNLMNSLKNEFNQKQNNLKDEYNSLKSADGTAITVQEIGAVNNTVSNNPDLQFTSTFIEKDGVVYQIVKPVTQSGYGRVYDMNEQYIIAYNKSDLKNTLGEYADKVYKNGKTYFEYISDALDSRVASGKSGGFLWDAGKGYNSDTANVINRVMNKVLQDSFVVNGFTSIPQNAALAGLVGTSNVIVTYGYGADREHENTIGFNGVTSSGQWDCIAFTKWSYANAMNYVYGKDKTQKIIKTLENDRKYNLQDISVNYSKRTSDLSLDEIAKIKPGTLVSKNNASHIGMVVGHGKYGNEDVVIVANAVVSKDHTVVEYYKVSEFAEKWGKYCDGDVVVSRMEKYI